MESTLFFTSDDEELNAGFRWAKAQALAYVFHHEPLGDWYEAALPGRAAFCMRDVSHQATGAHLLGLAGHTYNMLHRFAENISAQRDWCTYWEIDCTNQPCPVDYRDDSAFWYNLPANFDVLDCCWRQYGWTGNPDYLTDPDMRFFYARSVDEYVRQWDRDGDGLLEHDPADGIRGIASYDEQVDHPRRGGDLLAAQYAAYLAYAHMLALEQRDAQAEIYRQRAEHLRLRYEREWWNPGKELYSSYLGQDGRYYDDAWGGTNLFCLYFGLIRDPERLARSLDQVSASVPLGNVEARSYLPEVLFRYGRVEAAYRELKALFSPALERREYPELSYALLGALGTGVMGLSAWASERRIATLARLPGADSQAEMGNVHFLDSRLHLAHSGSRASVLTLQSGEAVVWQAAFAGGHETLLVDGRPQPARQWAGAAGQVESSVLLRVQTGETHRVSVP